MLDLVFPYFPLLVDIALFPSVTGDVRAMVEAEVIGKGKSLNTYRMSERLSTLGCPSISESSDSYHPR